MTCGPIPLALALLAFVVICWATILGVLRSRRTDAPPPGAPAEQPPVRRVRAGQAPTTSAPPAYMADTRPQISVARRAAIDSEARAAARQDFQLKHRRANPHQRHTREYACWAIAYSEEWGDQVIAGWDAQLQAIDTPPAAQRPATPPTQ